jgi:hypothetical protein
VDVRRLAREEWADLAAFLVTLTRGNGRLTARSVSVGLFVQRYSHRLTPGGRG